MAHQASARLNEWRQSVRLVILLKDRRRAEALTGNNHPTWRPNWSVMKSLNRPWYKKARGRRSG